MSYYVYEGDVYVDIAGDNTSEQWLCISTEEVSILSAPKRRPRPVSDFQLVRKLLDVKYQSEDAIRELRSVIDLRERQLAQAVHLEANSFTVTRKDSKFAVCLSWHADSEKLVIHTKSGGIYEYANVPAKLAYAMKEDRSWGKFYRANLLKNREFPASKLNGDD